LKPGGDADAIGKSTGKGETSNRSDLKRGQVHEPDVAIAAVGRHQIRFVPPQCRVGDRIKRSPSARAVD
jgi:hypothetical protein